MFGETDTTMTTYQFIYLTRDDMASIGNLSDVMAAGLLPVTTCEATTKVDKHGKVSHTSAEQNAASRVRSAAIGGGMVLKGRMASKIIKAKLDRDGWITGIAGLGTDAERLVLCVDPERAGSIGEIGDWHAVAREQLDAAAARRELAAAEREQALIEA